MCVQQSPLNCSAQVEGSMGSEKRVKHGSQCTKDIQSQQEDKRSSVGERTNGVQKINIPLESGMSSSGYNVLHYTVHTHTIY